MKSIIRMMVFALCVAMTGTIAIADQRISPTMISTEIDGDYTPNFLSRSAGMERGQSDEDSYQLGTELEYVTSLLWGGPRDAFLDSPHVYCAYPNGLGILNVSNPLDPIMVSTLYCPGCGEDICKAGNYVYLANGSAGLIIIDAMDPLNPLIVGSYPDLRYARDIVVEDSLAFVTCGNSAYAPADLIAIIGIADPSSPVLLSTYEMPNAASWGEAEDLFITDSIMLVAADHQGLEVVDISDPANPSLLSTYPNCWAKSVAVRDTLAFVISEGEYDPDIGKWFHKGLFVLNLANPLEPDSIASLEESPPGKLVLIDSLAIVTRAYNGSLGPFPEYYIYFKIIDVNDPSAPKLLGSTNSRWSDWLPNPTTVILDTFALLFNPYPGIEVYNISDPADPAWIMTIPSSGAIRLIREDSLLYVVTPEFPGFYIFDITNSAEPLPVLDYHVDTSQVIWWMDSWGLCVNDTLAYIPYIAWADSNLSWECICEVIDVSDPFNPVVVARPSLGEMDPPWVNIQIADTLLFLNNLIYNISDLANPVKIGYLDMWGAVRHLIVHDTIVFAASTYLAAFSIADPTAPINLTGSICPCSQNYGDINFQENLLFTTCDGMFSIYDVSDPMQFISISDCLYQGRSLDVHDYRVYLAGWYGVVIYDVSDPAAPVILDSISTPGEQCDILFGDSVVYIADLSSLFVVKTADISTDVSDYSDGRVIPGHYRLSQNYPNPFNHSTTIEFNLSRTSDVKLNIFNLMGQKVTTLIDRSLEAGRYKAIWYGSQAASGIYFYRLKAGDFIDSKKMLLLK